MSTNLSIQTMAGTSIAVSSVLPATHDEAGFAALTYTAVGEVTEVDTSPSREYDEVTHAPLATREEVRLKGMYRQSTVTMQLADDIDDAGQIKLKAGHLSDSCFAFQITYQNGDVDFFTALIFQFGKTGGGNNTVLGRTLVLNPQGDTIEVDTASVATVSITTPGSYTGDGTFPAAQASTSGTGTGAIFTVTVAGGVVTVVDSVDDGGEGYAVSDTITLTITGPTETTAAVLTVDSVV